MGFLSSKSQGTTSNLQSFTNGKESGLPIQTKLSVGSPGDPAEKEADEVARKVVENDAMKDKVQPKSEDKKDEVKKKSEEKKESSDSRDKIAKKEDKKDEVKKKSEEKKESSDSRDKIAKKEDKKDEVKKKSEEKKESSDSRDKIAKKEDKKDEVKKKSEDKKEDKIAKKEEEKPAISKSIQAKPNIPDKKAGEGTDDMDAIEQRLNATKGKGKALETGTKDTMEAQFEHDFSDVRIHTDSEAIELCQALNAQAFTHGRDVYFNAGKYDPQQTKGKELLAHELTHVVQQQRHIHRMVQRNPTPSGTSSAKYTVASGDNVGAWIDTGTKQMEIPRLNLPTFKGRNRAKYDAVKPAMLRRGGRGSTNQIANWQNDVRAAVTPHLTRKISEAEGRGGKNRANQYFFKSRQNDNFFLFGTQAQLLEYAMIPIWDKNGAGRSFQVDHVVEDQLGGADAAGNYELLDASANMSAGGLIGAVVRGKLRTISAELSAANSGVTFPSERTLKNNPYTVKVLDFDFTNRDASGTPSQFWSDSEIKRGIHLDRLRPMRAREVEELGRETDPVIFSSPNGGFRLTIPPNKRQRNWLPRVNLIDANIPGNDGSSAVGAGGTVTVEAFKADGSGFNKHPSAANPRMTWNIMGIDGVYGGAIDSTSVLQNVRRSLNLPGLSPIEMDNLEITAQGLVGRGRVLPTVPLVSDANIEIIIEGAEVRIRKVFEADEIHLPPPFSIENTSLEIFFGTRGLGIRGQTDFKIERVGKGHIGASASTSGGFELEGNFEFDPRLFNNARIDAAYRNEQWAISGTINIPQGKITGVRQATIQVSYGEQTFRATGSADLSVPGIQRADLSVVYNDAGFTLSGSFQLANNIPGIRSGSGTAQISRQAGQEDYSVSLSGTAVPNIPGVNSSISIAYQDGAITISGHVGYQRGMLSGSVDVGATNRAVGTDGTPSGGPTESLTFYGSGQLTLQLTPWLQATAGVKFLPNGEIEILGRIALPSSLDVFPRKEINKNLFRFPTIEIPIFAIPLGSRSIGLVGTIGGGLEGFAGIGPGQLRDTFLEVRYNPDHEDQTSVTGNARFVVPANAGLRLYARAGIGASVAIARVSGGLELGGSLAIEGEASAAVNVNWTPQTGLQLNAEANISVQPKFKFDVTAYVEASLDLLVTELSEEWRWTLAQFEYGSALTVGLRFPIHYQEGQPFDVSLDDVQFTYPDINLGEFARGIADRLM
jgi:hypothetical protein